MLISTPLAVPRGIHPLGHHLHPQLHPWTCQIKNFKWLEQFTVQNSPPVSWCTSVGWFGSSSWGDRCHWSQLKALLGKTNSVEVVSPELILLHLLWHQLVPVYSIDSCDCFMSFTRIEPINDLSSISPMNDLSSISDHLISLSLGSSPSNTTAWAATALYSKSKSTPWNILLCTGSCDARNIGNLCASSSRRIPVVEL